VNVLTFDEALHDADARGGFKHVLLGNGFSIACRPDRFTYGALLDEATFDEASTDLRTIFDLVGTTDFERIIELLQLAATLGETYGADPAFCDQLRHDAEVVREALARVLASRHPDYPWEIDDAEYEHARQFLGHFERIYTLNYDMLLYWTVMQECGVSVARNDGFGESDDPDADYVTWYPYDTFASQRVFYLHGSLHLYDNGPELSKITWSRTGIPLVTQIREALAERRYPLIVTEGTSDDKVAKILHSAYLNHAIRSFKSLKGSLFLYGLSLAPNDEHLLKRIEEGHAEALYVSVFGDSESTDNQQIKARAEQLAQRRPGRRPLTVQFYDADSAHPWRS